MLSPNGLRAILFDLDGTLRHNQPTFNQAFFDFAAELGAPVTPPSRAAAMRWQHFYWAYAPELVEDLEQFKGNDDLFWLNHIRKNLLALGCPAGQAEALAPELNRYMSEEFKPQDCVPAEVHSTLQTLKNAGFLLGVVTNRTKPFGDQFEKLGLSTYFDLALAAYEVNSWKPDPQIFLHAVERLGVLPDQAVYVGDNFYADVVGAQNAGLHPILLDSDGLFPEATCPVIQKIEDIVWLVSRKENNESDETIQPAPPGMG